MRTKMSRQLGEILYDVQSDTNKHLCNDQTSVTSTTMTTSLVSRKQVR